MSEDAIRRFEERVIDPLDMGIWSDDGTVWLPKRLYPTRNDAKRFAVAEMFHTWIETRVRTRWMRDRAGEPGVEADYSFWLCSPDDEGAFECWEIT